MEVLVTGSSGFIGKNLLERLSRIENVKIHTFDIEDKLEDLEKIIDKINFVFHLAGINRPQNIDEFYKGNRDTIKDLEMEKISTFTYYKAVFLSILAVQH